MKVDAEIGGMQPRNTIREESRKDEKGKTKNEPCVAGSEMEAQEEPMAVHSRGWM